MNIATEPESFAELIADCAAIPASLHTAVPVPLRTISAPDWAVSERCHAQVAELDAFVEAGRAPHADERATDPVGSVARSLL